MDLDIYSLPDQGMVASNLKQLPPPLRAVRTPMAGQAACGRQAPTNEPGLTERHQGPASGKVGKFGKGDLRAISRRTDTTPGPAASDHHQQAGQKRRGGYYYYSQPRGWFRPLHTALWSYHFLVSGASFLMASLRCSTDAMLISVGSR